jgi:membrane fusion protein, multidrug efflux system
MHETSESGVKTPNNRISKTRLRLITILLLIGALLAVGYWWFIKRYRVTTDNAYVMADSARISSRLPGTIQRVVVENDQPVQTGQVLAELDPHDYQAERDQAVAAVARIGAEMRAAQVTVPLTNTRTSAQVRETEALVQASRDKVEEAGHRLEELQQKRLAALAEFKHAERDYERYDNLYLDGAGTEQQRDRTSTARKKAKAQLEAADAEIAALRAFLQAAGQEVDRTRAQHQASLGDRRRVEIEELNLAALKAELAEKQAKLQAAELQLSYCTITAPISGYISQKNIQLGDRVQPGQPLMSVVPLQDVYVEANFKETQLEHVRVGQKTTVHADIYPGHTYRGRVTGIRAGTGAAFSMLPPENATGNWIKVVQRVPVRIDLDQPPQTDHPLRVGLSLEVTIDTHDRSGATLLVHSSTAR